MCVFSIFRIEHKLNISTQCSSDLALSMLKNGQRVNINGYMRSNPFSKTLPDRLSNTLAGCQISIIPKTVQLSADAIDYMDKCIAILQGYVRSDLECDTDSCKFVLETFIPKRFDCDLIFINFFLLNIRVSELNQQHLHLQK